jgi:hypothetical protein
MTAMETTSAAALRWRQPDASKPVPLTRFVPLLKTAVAAAPNRADLRLQLAQALFQTHQFAELIDWVRPAASSEAADPELQFFLGRSALAVRDYPLAVQAFRSAATKGCTSRLGYLAEALYALDRPTEALEAALEGLDQRPTDWRALKVAARVLLDQAEAARLWALSVDLRARGVWGMHLPAAMAQAATTPERCREVATLVDPTRWFSSTPLRVPDEFNENLAAELLASKSLGLLPASYTTIGAGNRIDELHVCGGPLAQELLGLVRNRVEGYVAERQHLGDHPMMAHQPACVELDSWAVAVQRDGREKWHLHPSGWISGVYYVRVPEVRPCGEGHPGAIEFGPYPFGLARDVPAWPRWHVMPQAGMLLLFPSYYAHRTWPTGVRDPRICIAFDVIPWNPLAV